MINRRPKLPQLGLKQSGSDYLKVNAKTEPTIDDVPIKTNKTEDINNMNDEQKAK